MTFGLSEAQKAQIRTQRNIDAILARFKGEVMCGDVLGRIELALEDEIGGKAICCMVPGDRSADLESTVRVGKMVCRNTLLIGSAPP